MARSAHLRARGGELPEARAHPVDRRAQLVMVQLEHLPQHGALEHAREALRVARRDLGVERIGLAPGSGGVGMEQAHGLALHHESRDHIAVPVEHLDQPADRPRARRPRPHDLCPLAASDLVLDRGVLEPGRGAAKLLEHVRRGAGVVSTPQSPGVQLGTAHLAEHDVARSRSWSRAPRRRVRGFPAARRPRLVGGPRRPPAPARPRAARTRPRRSHARAPTTRPACAGPGRRQRRPTRSSRLSKRLRRTGAWRAADAP